MFRRDDCDLTQRWFRPYGAIGEHVGKLTFVNKHRRLTFADCQFGAILNLVIFAFKTPNHRVPRVVDPMNDVDEFTG